MDAEADGTNVLDALYSNKTSLETIFNIIDADNSGLWTLFSNLRIPFLKTITFFR